MAILGRNVNGQKGGKNDNNRSDYSGRRINCHSDGMEHASFTRLPYRFEEYCISAFTDCRCFKQEERMNDRMFWAIYIISTLMAGLGYAVLLGCLLIAAQT